MHKKKIRKDRSFFGALRANTNRAVKGVQDESGSVESALVLIPLLILFLITMQIGVAINFRNLDDLIAKGDFLAAFSKQDLEEVYKFLELERQIGSHNMAMEGGKFLLMGPDYIRDFFKLQSHHIKPDKKKEILIKRLINRSEDIYNLFIRLSKLAQHLLNIF